MEGDQYRGRCENLSEEYQYRFRVIAVNKAGKSQPGPSSDNVVAMHKNISPFIKVIHIYKKKIRLKLILNSREKV